MKPSTKDQVEGKLHAVKGKLKEDAGKISGNRELEDKGTMEKIGGKTQHAVGKIEKAVGA
jgi:uncharacterized protein YjbJ (UPF0337 family)